ncbi:unnamed protein product [Allacma fusca]|uniref:CCZ1/INTU/HSP4 first Longin domain-containing protein n=1 Tax=Allacma fusca TaxID=39272 RepID=A0A8J2KDU6_9HEXA|nr:unnamed protein product [Allacma fusca]
MNWSELQIVFIYDTLSCRKEEDDPKEAILYFHPSNVSEEKKLAICGQLMGITHFLMDSFSTPQILTLENVKFSLRKFGKQYVMAMGCSSKTPDWLLDKQADILYSLTKFFHRDIQSILANANGDRNLLSSKLTAMMDHYIPVTQHHGDLFALTFGILPVLSVPKSTNSVSIQASAILQNCMMKKGVLGGVIMYQNKAVGVELCQDVAQKLAFIQLHQLPPADCVTVSFDMPVGVNLFVVYVSEHDMKLIKRRASAFQQPSLVCYANNGIGPNNNDPSREESSSDMSSSIGFSEVSSLYLENASNHSNQGHSGPVSTSSASETDTQCYHTGNLEHQDCNGNTETTMDTPELISSPCHPSSGIFSLFRRSLSQPNLSDYKKTNENISCSLPDPCFPWESPSGRQKLCSEPVDEKSVVVGILRESDPDSDNSSPWCRESLNRDVLVNSESAPSSIEHEGNLSNAPSNSGEIHNGWGTFKSLNRAGSESPDSHHPSFQNELSPDVSSNSTTDTSEKFSGSQPKFKEPVGADIDISSVMHMRMMNSFRKLSSHEDLSSCQSSSENERAYNGMPPFAKYENYKRSSIQGTDSRSSGISNSKGREPVEESYEKAYLFIFGRGSMRLLLIMDADQSLDATVIQTLHDQGINGLAELEVSISNTEEELPVGINHSDPYCYLKYEPIWKSLAHSGKNHSMNFDVVQLMHKNFTAYPNMSELIIRGDDHVVYGYQCVGSEVYYQQSASLFSGVPMPTDLMGKVPLKAKRRLERDHKIILL